MLTKSCSRCVRLTSGLRKVWKIDDSQTVCKTPQNTPKCLEYTFERLQVSCTLLKVETSISKPRWLPCITPVHPSSFLLSPGPDSWLPSHSPLASMAGAHVGTGEGWRKATIGGEGWKVAGRTWRNTESKLHGPENHHVH